MTTFRLLTPDAQYSDDGLIERQTAGENVIWSIQRIRRPEDLPAGALAECDAMVVWHELAVDRAVIDQMHRCRIIVRAGVGFDHIDLQAAGDAGIPVCNTPDYGTSEVADHAIGLMLALSRGIVGYHQELAADPVAGFDHNRAPLVRRVRGLTFGIVGLGRIGIATAIRAKAFGMRVVAYDPYVSRGTEIALGVERVDNLTALLQQSDVVSLHCPLTEETRGMVNADMLRLMKPEAILINTARGAVVDVPALLQALNRGIIAGAGIDVLAAEPPCPGDEIVRVYRDRTNPLIGNRLILTPHAAWFSPESAADARRLSVETAMMYLRDGRLRNLVNTPRRRGNGV